MTIEFDRGAFEGQVKASLQAIKESLERIEETFKDHELRLRTLEADQTRLKTWASAAGAIAGALVGLVIKLIPGFPKN